VAVEDPTHIPSEVPDMNRFLGPVALAVAPLALAADKPAGVPEGYKPLYSQDFTKGDAIKDFAFPDPSAWRMTEINGKRFLEQFQNARYDPPHRSPFNFCLIAGKKFGDFVMDVECQETAKESPHRDMVFVFGYQGPARFYYAHIASTADDHANQVFIVKDAPRTKISRVTNKGNNWGTDAWRTVRVERKASDGTIKVYFDDLSKPVMEAEDRAFGAGWAGFGTFDDTCRVRKVTVYGPSAEDALAPEFARKK
jgi:hypothetical protein